MEHYHRPAARQRHALILCFDGTGNKFSGNSGDSNIIKIFSMIDRQNPHVHSYYQPGIGTYIEDSGETFNSEQTECPTNSRNELYRKRATSLGCGPGILKPKIKLWGPALIAMLWVATSS